MGFRSFQGVAFIIIVKRLFIFPSVFIGIAQGKTQLNAVILAGRRVCLHCRHLCQFVFGEHIGFCVRQTPVGIAMIPPDPVCFAVKFYGLVDIAVCFVYMGQGNRERNGFQDALPSTSHSF